MERIDKECLRQAFEHEDPRYFIDLLCEKEAHPLTMDDELIEWMNESALTLLHHGQAHWVSNLIHGTDHLPEKPWTNLDPRLVAATIAFSVGDGDRDSLTKMLPAARGVYKADPAFLDVTNMVTGDALEQLVDQEIQNAEELAARGGFSLGDRVASIMDALFLFPEILSRSHAPAARYAEYVLKSVDTAEISDEDLREMEDFWFKCSQDFHKQLSGGNLKSIRTNQDIGMLREKHALMMKPDFIKAVEKNQNFSDLVGLHCRLYPSLYPNAARAYGGNTPVALPAPRNI